MKDPESNSVASRPLAASCPGDVRIGPILAIPAVLTELGVRPQRAFAQAGLNPQVFQDAESRLPFEAVGRLLEIWPSRLTGCLHFGLLVEVKALCAALQVSPSGYYAARSRPPSAREERQSSLTTKIREVHTASRQTYGAPRVHAELSVQECPAVATRSPS